MRTQKRAKPVKFGQHPVKKEAPAPPKISKKEEEITKSPKKAEIEEVLKIKETPAAAKPEEPAKAEEIKEPAKVEEIKEIPKAEEVKESPHPFTVDVGTPLSPTLSDKLPPAQESAQPEPPQPAPPSVYTPPTTENLSSSPVPATPAVSTENTKDAALSPTPELQQPVAPAEQTATALPYSSDNMELKMDEDGSGRGKGRLRYFLLVTLIAFLVGLAFITGGYYAMKKNVKIPLMSSIPFLHNSGPTPGQSTSTNSSIGAVSKAPTIIPTTSKKPDLSAYTIIIQNGSGISGEASKLKGQLTTAGYTVSSIGNADNSDYVNTQISVKSTVDKTYVDGLRESLAKSYTLDDTKTQSSAASGGAGSK